MNLELIRDTTQVLLRTFPLIKAKLMSGIKTGQECTHGQLLILFTLDECGALSMSEISTKTAISNQQLTRIVDELIAGGYAVRFENKENRRQVLAELTQLGKTFLQQKRKAFLSQCEALFCAYTEEDMEKLNESIHTIHSVLAKDTPIH